MLQPPDLSAVTVAQILDDLPEVAFIYRADGLLMAVNRACEEMSGVPRELVVGRFNIFDNATSIDPLLLDGYHQAFRGRSLVVPATELRLAEENNLGITVKTTMRWAETVLVAMGRTADGGAPYVLGISRDVTERVRAQQEIAVALARIDVQKNTIDSLEAARREIETQKATIEALSTPVIEVWDGIITLPLLGYFDVARADAMTAQVLGAVSQIRPQHVILDLTGMVTIDAATAQHIQRLIKAVGLLGANGVLVGIQAGLAQTFIELGVDLGRVHVHQNLRQALKACIAGR